MMVNINDHKFFWLARARVYKDRTQDPCSNKGPICSKQDNSLDMNSKWQCRSWRTQLWGRYHVPQNVFLTLTKTVRHIHVYRTMLQTNHHTQKFGQLPAKIWNILVWYIKCDCTGVLSQY